MPKKSQIQHGWLTDDQVKAVGSEIDGIVLKNIELYLKKYPMKQVELSEKVCISSSDISAFKRGSKPMGTRTYAKFSIGLGLPVVDLFNPKVLNDVKNSDNKYKNSYSAQSDDMDKLKIDLERSRGMLEFLQKEFSKITNSLENLTSDNKRLNAELEAAHEEIKRLKN